MFRTLIFSHPNLIFPHYFKSCTVKKTKYPSQLLFFLSFYSSVLSLLSFFLRNLFPFLKKWVSLPHKSKYSKEKKKSISRTRCKHIFEERNYDFTLICYIHQHATNLPHKNQLSVCFRILD